VPTSKLRTHYTTTDPEPPDQNKARKFVMWHEVVFFLTAGLIAFTLHLPLISFGAEWGTNGRVIAVRLDGVVSRWAADDVRLYDFTPKVKMLMRDVQHCARPCNAIAQQLAAARREHEKGIEKLREVLEKDYAVVNADGSINVRYTWDQVLEVARDDWPRLATLTLLIFLLTSTSIGIRSNIIEHSGHAWLAACTLRQGLKYDLFDLKTSGARSHELWGIRTRMVVGPPLVFLLWLLGFSFLGNKLRL